jgi:hypothetical protein
MTFATLVTQALVLPILVGILLVLILNVLELGAVLHFV